MIIGISGKKRAGKDLIGKIIQYLTSDPKVGFEEWLMFKSMHKSIFKIVKYADKLKDIVCLLIGCTREQLENEEFKNTQLGEEWRVWKYEIDEDVNLFDGSVLLDNKGVFLSFEEAEAFVKEYKLINVTNIYSEKVTPRKMLQFIGTDLLRNQLHPNIWVNATMADYTSSHSYEMCSNPKDHESCYPNWIITDCRFPNEAEAIKERDGILIRVNRFDENGMPWKSDDLHESETALDDYSGFDYTINNDSSIDKLIDAVKIILTKEGII